jgi:hypothetical protein
VRAKIAAEFMVTQRRKDAKTQRKIKKEKGAENHEAGIILCVFASRRKPKQQRSTTKILLKPVIGRLCEKGVPKNDD